MELKKLNLGCGTDIRAGWINLDSADISGVDVVHDLGKLPLPFASNSFDEILCLDILEHLEYIPVLKDLHRILMPGGKLRIRVPHFTSKNNFMDPTHKKLFSVNTFDYFTRGSASYERRPYYFDFYFSTLSDKRITFERSARFFFYNRFTDFLVNRTAGTQERYESTGFSRLFPAQNIIVTLTK